MLESIISTYNPTPTGKQQRLQQRQQQLQQQQQRQRQQQQPQENNQPQPDHPAGPERKPFVSIPYIPGGLSNKIQRICHKAGCNVAFKPGAKLQNVLCSKNKWKPPPNEQKGVYCFECPNSGKKYIGKTRRKIVTRALEHKKAAEKGQWQHSGLTAHREHCNAPIDWENPRILATMQSKNQKSLDFDLQIREALEIMRHDCGPGKGLNEDNGNYVKTDIWRPVFHRINR